MSSLSMKHRPSAEASCSASVVLPLPGRPDTTTNGLLIRCFDQLPLTSCLNRERQTRNSVRTELGVGTTSVPLVGYTGLLFGLQTPPRIHFWIGRLHEYLIKSNVYE
jgi:hypothetical protein